ncbi:hypothetical protein BOH66_06245 [Microbacterium aurum]|uniref:2-deoxyglucose-6-phosphatase n=1 Tax=Microbacterium aurum TaxID=36805 RepID=A0A1P8U726_9MICO|nr:HAD-IA family hydrolase [Microbacterium aurum]APZ33899.1 hypothetical protein BOH66_06245 [Microbacterium aurum]MBM7827660.1 sugar-phosphatase [Microbacterium aurum]
MTSIHADALLFDMDGTLVDSTELVESIWRAFASRNGLDFAEVIEFAHGRPTSATVRRFSDDDAHFAIEMTRITDEEIAGSDAVREVPGAADFIGSIGRDRLAVVTSASRQIAVQRLVATGIAVPDVLITADDVAQGKPSPEGYRAALRQLSAAASESVVFEDAEAGLLAGIASGARTVVVGDYASDSTAGLLRIPDFLNLEAQMLRRKVVITWL